VRPVDQETGEIGIDDWRIGKIYAMGLIPSSMVTLKAADSNIASGRAHISKRKRKGAQEYGKA